MELPDKTHAGRGGGVLIHHRPGTKPLRRISLPAGLFRLPKYLNQNLQLPPAGGLSAYRRAFTGRPAVLADHRTSTGRKASGPTTGPSCRPEGFRPTAGLCAVRGSPVTGLCPDRSCVPRRAPHRPRVVSNLPGTDTRPGHSPLPELNASRSAMRSAGPDSFLPSEGSPSAGPN